MDPSPITPPSWCFCRDETVRWSCRIGELVLWVGTDSFLSADRASAWDIRDFWEMRDGDFVTITNRWADLPAWFELNPIETADAAAFEMMKRLKAGYRPKEPMDGPNIWRPKAGDRLVWVTTKDARQPVREILTLRTCAVAIGENPKPSSEALLFFGVQQNNEMTPAYTAAGRAGFEAAVAIGIPREFVAEWRFGS